MSAFGDAGRGGLSALVGRVPNRGPSDSSGADTAAECTRSPTFRPKMGGARQGSVALACVADRRQSRGMKPDGRRPNARSRMAALMSAALSTIAGIPAVSAQPTENRDKARAIVAEGAKLFDEGKFEEALRR